MSKRGDKTLLTRSKILALEMVRLVINSDRAYGSNAVLLEVDIIVRQRLVKYPEMTEASTSTITINALIAPHADEHLTEICSFDCIFKDNNNNRSSPFAVNLVHPTRGGLFWIAAHKPHGIIMEIREGVRGQLEDLPPLR